MDEFLPAATRVHGRLAGLGWMVGVAESCTGGLLAAALTHPAGASATFERGFVTYSNSAKCEDLSVPAELIATYGAVSAQVAEAMALGCARHARVRLALAITGIAGPGGGSDTKPVGLVFFGCAFGAAPQTMVREHRFGPQPRGAIRALAVHAALAIMEEALGYAIAPPPP